AITEVAAHFQNTADGDRVDLKVPLTRSRIVALALRMTPVNEDDEENEDEKQTPQTTLENLYMLSQHGGVMIRKTGIKTRTKQHYETTEIVVARQLPLPTLPTLILDATGELDPEYPQAVQPLQLSSWEGETLATLDTKLANRPLMLWTREENATKSKVTDS